MPPPTELDLFLTLSQILTGEETLNKPLAEAYLLRLKTKNPTQMQKILTKFASLAADPYLAFEVKRRILETKVAGEEDLPLIAQQIIRVWFTSEFFVFGADGKLSTATSTGTQDEYYSGLLWPVVQAHAPSNSKKKYGYWTKRPAAQQ